MSEAAKRECEKCKGALERLISRSAFHLKGGGWYKDLYSSPKPADSPSTASAESSKSTAGSSAEASDSGKSSSDSGKSSGDSGKSSGDSGSGTSSPAPRSTAAGSAG
jgi:predicted nucleic acid-binding Zn ribbon protein